MWVLFCILRRTLKSQMTKYKFAASKNDLIGQIIYGVVLFSLVLGLIIWQYNSAKVRKSILNNTAIGTAIITRITESTTKGRKTFVTFKFQTPNGTRTATNRYLSNNLKFPKSCYHHFIGKRFPIAYSDEFPDKAHLLFLRRDFVKYGQTFPDSLKWVEPIAKGLPHYVDGRSVDASDSLYNGH